MTEHRNLIRLDRHLGEQEDEEYRRRKAAYARDYRIRNPEKRHKRTPEEARRQNLMAYGMTIEDYDDLKRRQGGTCAICLQPEVAIGNHGEVKRMSVDHDHVTGEIRGLLCQACNVAIGMLGDDPDRLLAASFYILKSTNVLTELSP